MRKIPAAIVVSVSFDTIDNTICDGEGFMFVRRFLLEMYKKNKISLDSFRPYTVIEVSLTAVALTVPEIQKMSQTTNRKSLVPWSLASLSSSTTNSQSRDVVLSSHLKKWSLVIRCFLVSLNGKSCIGCERIVLTFC